MAFISSSGHLLPITSSFKTAFRSPLKIHHVGGRRSAKLRMSVLDDGRPITRRSAVLRSFNMIGLGVMLRSSNAFAEEVAASDVSESAAKGVRKGRLAPCPSDASCFSTSASGSPDKYISPWTFPEGVSSKDAAKQLVDYFDSSKDFFSVVKSQYPYLVVEYNGGAINGITDMEFLFREGDSTQAPFVTLRAMNRRSNQFYAFSGPSNNVKALLNDTRASLGWNTIVDADLFSR